MMSLNPDKLLSDNEPVPVATANVKDNNLTFKRNTPNDKRSKTRRLFLADGEVCGSVDLNSLGDPIPEFAWLVST